MKLKNILLTGALTLSLGADPSLAQETLDKKLASLDLNNYVNGNLIEHINSGKKCDISLYNNGNLRQAAHESMFNYVAIKNPLLIEKKCGEISKSHFSQSDLLSVVNSTDSVDFKNYDSLLRTFIHNPTLQPEVLIGDYKIASSTIKNNRKVIKEFMNNAKQNPMIRPLWETSKIGKKSNTVNIQFILRRLVNLGYTSDNYLDGLSKLDNLTNSYENFLFERNKL